VYSDNIGPRPFSPRTIASTSRSGSAFRSVAVTFHGEYKGSVREPRITHGVNKDHRPDLKQLVFGLNVTADGAVPISHDIFSGHSSDDTIHRSNVDRLRELLGHDDFVYVADCKLCTEKNLQHIANYGGKFVTILPRSRAEDRRFRKKLREGHVRWRRLLVVENKRRKSAPPEIYWTTTDGPNTTKEGYRIVWWRSSQKASLDAEVREKTLRKAEADLLVLNARLNRGKLCKRGAIHGVIKKVLRTHDCESFLRVKVGSHVEIRTKRLRPGRPKADDPVKQIRTRVFHLEVRRDKEALRSEARTDGVFPQVTNLSPREATKRKVLIIYKYQPYVEKRHALFKTELGVAPVYIKKPLRAAGLVHATYLAMVVDALIERALRHGMQREGFESLPILPEGRTTKTPTSARLLEVFSDVSWYAFERGDETVTFPVQLSPLQKQLLRLLDMEPSAYA